MFWFSRSTLEKLCLLPKKFSNAEENKIALSFAKKIGLQIKFVFRKDFYVYIENKEIEYFETIIDSIFDKKEGITLINNVISKNNLWFDGNQLINENGTCAVVSMFKKDGCIVARKTARKSVDTIEMIKNEYNLLLELNKINSRYFVNIHENSFADNGFLMEFANDSLESYIIRNKDLSFEEKKKLILEICFIIDAMHRANITHCDLHQGNVLCFIDKEIKIWKLIDFGYSKKLTYNTEKDALESKTNIKIDLIGIGNIINFILTGVSGNFSHTMSAISEKCTKHLYRTIGEVIFDIETLFERF